MNFDWTDEEKEVKKQVAAVFDQESLQELERLESADPPELKGILKSFLARLATTGYLRLGVGPGASRDTLKLMAGQEDLASSSSSLYLAVEVSARMFGGLLSGFGPSKALEEILSSATRGEIIGGVAVTEPAEPQAKNDLRTTAWTDGNNWVVSGQKDFVTNGPVADFIAVVAESDGRPVIAVVDPSQEGMTIGPRLGTLGYKGLAVASVELRDARVSKDMVIGPFDNRSPLDFLRLVEDLVLTVASVGLIKRTVFAAKEYAQEHERSGKPIFAHQEVRFKVAEMLTLYQTAQLLAYRAGWTHSTSDPETAVLIHCAKVFSSEAAEKVAGMAMQIFAGQGYVTGSIAEKAYRDSKYAGLAGTTCERARMAIADDLLKRYPA